MKRCLVEKWLTGPLLVGALMAARLPAQDVQTAKPAAPDRSAPGGTASASAGEENGKIKAGETALTKYSVGIDEILKMVQAGISKEVIRTYIDNSPIPYNLSASDLIALKERGVTDDLTTALMKRGAVVRAQANQAAVPGSAEPHGSASGASIGPDRRGHFDPEGYDYFWYYYLYPRTLASANQRFYSSGAPLDFYPYSYGYYEPAPFRPLPFRRP